METGLTQTYIAIPQQGPLSLYTKLEGPPVAKVDFYFPRAGRDDF